MLGPMTIGALSSGAGAASGQFVDTFTDTNGTALADHTPDTDTSENGWSEVSGTWVIDANRVRPNTLGGGASNNLATADIGLSDCVVALRQTAGGINTCVAFRYSDNNNFWFARWNGNLSPAKVQIFEVNGGSTTNRAQTDYTPSDTDNYVIEVTLSGTTITVVIDDDVASETVYASATHNETETSHGLHGRDSDVRMDDFSIQPLA